MNYARHQQYRRLSRGGRLALTSTAVALLGAFVVSTGAALAAALLLVVAVLLGLRARHWLSLARRSGIGARSEDEVRRALEPLREHGWRLRHALGWSGPGDLDSVAIAPNGVGFAIETKTRTYDERHLARVWEQAVWLWRRRPRWCRRGATPVLCVVRARSAAVGAWRARRVDRAAASEFARCCSTERSRSVTEQPTFSDEGLRSDVADRCHRLDAKRTTPLRSPGAAALPRKRSLAGTSSSVRYDEPSVAIGLVPSQTAESANVKAG